VSLLPTRWHASMPSRELLNLLTHVKNKEIQK
jgi:hypothetical protein